MIKPLICAALALWAAATATAATQTNILQNINLQLTIYQQGATNANGRKIADQVTSYTTKSLITNLEAVTGQTFEPGAKLVQSTVYPSVDLLSTNLTLATNSYLSVGGIPFYGSFYGNAGTMTISNNTIIIGEFPGDIPNSILSVVTDGTTNESVAIETNALTTLTPSTDTNGFVTNVAVVTLGQATTIDILYGGTANNLYSVNNYLSFTTNNSAEIVVETGSGLNTTNALTVTNLASQTGFSIQGLTINYFTPTGPNNLTLSLQGFVKQSLKVDTLYARGTNRIVEDIFGASSTWNVNGSGYAGGTYTTNPTSVPIPGGFLTNASPIVVIGSVSVSFLKNLPK